MKAPDAAPTGAPTSAPDVAHNDGPSSNLVGQSGAGTGPPITRHVVSVSANCSRCGRGMGHGVRCSIEHADGAGHYVCPRCITPEEEARHGDV